MTFEEIGSSYPFKANIFVDWLNVKANGGYNLDFQKLIRLVREKGGLIVRANCYLPEADDKQIGFYDAIKGAGFKLVIIREKYERVNCDALMAVDMVTQSLDVDAVYILSNDSDFIPAVVYLQSIGKRVLLIHGDNPSNDLRKTVDEWKHFTHLKLLRD